MLAHGETGTEDQDANCTGSAGAACKGRCPRFQRRARSGTRDRRSGERRDAILAAALDEFAARGFAATRLEDVAKRADTAKGTILGHCTDKKSLFQELVRLELSPLVGALGGASHAYITQLQGEFIIS